LRAFNARFSFCFAVWKSATPTKANLIAAYNHRGDEGKNTERITFSVYPCYNEVNPTVTVSRGVIAMWSTRNAFKSLIFLDILLVDTLYSFANSLTIIFSPRKARKKISRTLSCRVDSIKIASNFDIFILSKQ
jgi:hypothetical protein